MPISQQRIQRRSLRRLALAAATSALIAASAMPASASTLDLPVGRIDGAVVSLADSLVITATTDGGGRGTALYTGRGAVGVTVDCVRTYAAVGAILFPIVGAYGYASGIGSDGHRYYILVNEGYGVSVSRQAGPPLPFDTCGVGYVIPRVAATAVAIVPQTSHVWTWRGLV